MPGGAGFDGGMFFTVDPQAATSRHKLNVGNIRNLISPPVLMDYRPSALEGL